jgi:hypothetical protein
MAELIWHIILNLNALGHGSWMFDPELKCTINAAKIPIYIYIYLYTRPGQCLNLVGLRCLDSNTLHPGKIPCKAFEGLAQPRILKARLLGGWMMGSRF